MKDVFTDCFICILVRIFWVNSSEEDSDAPISSDKVRDETLCIRGRNESVRNSSNTGEENIRSISIDIRVSFCVKREGESGFYRISVVNPWIDLNRLVEKLSVSI